MFTVSCQRAVYLLNKGMDKEARIAALHLGSDNWVAFLVVDVVLPLGKHDRDSVRGVGWDGSTDLSRGFHCDVS